MPTPSSYVPRDVHDRNVMALTDRYAAAEACVIDLLTLINPEWRQRHAGDWLAAVKELTA